MLEREIEWERQRTRERGEREKGREREREGEREGERESESVREINREKKEETKTYKQYSESLRKANLCHYYDFIPRYHSTSIIGVFFQPFVLFLSN